MFIGRKDYSRGESIDIRCYRRNSGISEPGVSGAYCRENMMLGECKWRNDKGVSAWI